MPVKSDPGYFWPAIKVLESRLGICGTKNCKTCKNFREAVKLLMTANKFFELGVKNYKPMNLQKALNSLIKSQKGGLKPCR